VIALYTMERDFKNAGMGFNDTTFAGCNIVGFDNKRATPDFPPAGVTMKLAPVFITSGAATTAPDQISVLYGSQPQAAGSVPLFSDMDATKNGADDLFVTNPFGYSTGDLLVMVEPVTVKNCSVMEVTKINANQIAHDLSAYLAAGSAHNPRFNKNGGWAWSTKASARRTCRAHSTWATSITCRLAEPRPSTCPSTTSTPLRTEA